MQVDAAVRATILLVVAAHRILAEDRLHGWVIVDLEQPGLQVLVNQDIEAKDLVDLRFVFWLLGGVRILRVNVDLHEVRQHGHRGGTGLFDIGFDRLYRFFVTNLFPERGQRPLAAGIGLENVLYLVLINPCLTRLVDAVIRQVHVCLFEVGLRRLLVLLCAETRQAFIMQEGVHLPVLDSGDDNVHAQVKLESIHQKWVREVPLDDHAIPAGVSRHVFEVLEEGDSITHAAALRLGNECRLFIGGLILIKFVLVSRDVECPRDKVVFVSVLAVEADVHHDLRVVLARDVLDVGIPVDDAATPVLQYVHDLLVWCTVPEVSHVPSVFR